MTGYGKPWKPQFLWGKSPSPSHSLAPFPPFDNEDRDKVELKFMTTRKSTTFDRVFPRALWAWIRLSLIMVKVVLTHGHVPSNMFRWNIARGTTDPEIDSVTWITFSNNMDLLHLVQIWPPDGATCIGCKFGPQMAPLALVTNLTTRWCNLH